MSHEIDPPASGNSPDKPQHLPTYPEFNRDFPIDRINVNDEGRFALLIDETYSDTWANTVLREEYGTDPVPPQIAGSRAIIGRFIKSALERRRWVDIHIPAAPLVEPEVTVRQQYSFTEGAHTLQESGLVEEVQEKDLLRLRPTRQLMEHIKSKIGFKPMSSLKTADF